MAILGSLRLWGALAAVGLILSVITAIYVKGRADGANKAYVNALEDTLEDFQKWDMANVEAESLDDFERCVALGGLAKSAQIALRDA